MEKENLPKKILVIKDCTFILPENFEGTLEDAFTEFLKYRQNIAHPQYYDELNLFSTFDILLHGGENTKVCGQYAIYELVDGRYHLKEGTNPN